MNISKEEILKKYLNKGEVLFSFYQNQSVFGEIYIKKDEKTFGLFISTMSNNTKGAFDEENQPQIEFKKISSYNQMKLFVDEKFEDITFLNFNKSKNIPSWVK